MEKNKKQALILSIVGVLTLITLVAGATFAFFKVQGGEGGSSKVDVTTATTDLLTFKIDKAINISISQSEFKKGNPDASDSTGAHLRSRAIPHAGSEVLGLALHPSVFKYNKKGRQKQKVFHSLYSVCPKII